MSSISDCYIFIAAVKVKSDRIGNELYIHNKEQVFAADKQIGTRKARESDVAALDSCNTIISLMTLKAIFTNMYLSRKITKVVVSEYD